MGFFSRLFGFENNSKEAVATSVLNGAFLVDVRSESEFKTGSVKGAVNIPVDNITAQIDQFKGKESVVVFCRSGNRSRMAKTILKDLGIQNITDGGTWQSVNQIILKNKK